MKRRRNAPMVLLLVATLAMAGAGILYAHWTETLTVDGVVDTGELAAGWLDVACDDVGNHLDFTVFPYGTVLGHDDFEKIKSATTGGGVKFDLYQTDKDVGQTIVEPIDLTAFPPSVSITHDIVYPSYYEDCQMEFRNDGSIPLAVPYLVIDPTSDNFDLASNLFADDGAVWLEWAGAESIDQIDPGKSATASLKFHLEQFSSNQDTTYEYTITLCVHNWNEPSTVYDDVCDLWAEGDGKIVIPDPFGP